MTPAWQGISAAIASYANPIFYSESADSTVQPDYQEMSSCGRSRSKSRSRKNSKTRTARSRSPMDEEGEEAKESTERHDKWKVTCRELFWSVMSGQLSRPVPSEDVPSGASGKWN